jgi:hypothetical protein
MIRDRLLDKIRALLSKTQANGCTEAEAFASLDKARALMDAYEVTSEELRLTKEGADIIFKATRNDEYGVRSYLAFAVSRFCDCRILTNRNGDTLFVGLRSDVQFADWLLDHLANFVRAALAAFLIGRTEKHENRRQLTDSFVYGCTGKISGRLLALIVLSAQRARDNSRALVVIKIQKIDAFLAERGIHLPPPKRCGGPDSSVDGYNAGLSAGERASFNRPLSGDTARRPEGL